MKIENKNGIYLLQALFCAINGLFRSYVLVHFLA